MRFCELYSGSAPVPAVAWQDWATHMIGHELTALYDIDHARTLAVVLPAPLELRRDSKREIEQKRK